MLPQQNRNNLLKACTLAIASSTLTAKITDTAYGKIDGKYVTIAGQDMPALTDIDIAVGYSRIIAFYTDGTSESLEYSDEIANTADIKFEDFPAEKKGYLLLGWIYIKNASASVLFEGGTTALTASDVTTLYFDNFGQVGDL